MQRTPVLEANPVSDPAQVVLVPLTFVNSVSIGEESVTLTAGGADFVCTREQWDAVTINR